MNIGGWSDFVSPVTEEEKKIFDKVIERFVGISYTPIAAAIQIITEKNYCYICLAKAMVPNAPVTVAKVNVYAPVSGEPHVTAIQPVTP